MPRLGLFVKQKLLEAGRRGTTASDLYRLSLQEPSRMRKVGSTYSSFSRFFHWFKALKFVELTGREEVSVQRGATDGGVLLAPRRYYRITAKGRRAPDEAWADPIGAVHPQWKGRLRREKYRRKAPKKVPRKAPPPTKAPPRIKAPPRELLSMRLRREAATLRPAIEVLKERFDAKGVAAVEEALTKLFDRAVDALERASGEERKKIESFAKLQEQAFEGFEAVRRGLARKDRTAYLAGLAMVETCCPEI